MVSRKRTCDGDVKEVYVSFKTRIPAGSCKFVVKVPKLNSDRHFFFSSLFLTPDFYSLEAAFEDLDDPDIINTPIAYKLQFKTIFISNVSLHPDEFWFPKSYKKHSDLLDKLNTFFEAKKPSICPHLGCFFDWTDLRYREEEGETWDDFVRKMAVVYYNVPFDESKHFNTLPPSARSVPGSNNYLFPTELNEETINNLRIRLFLAPNINASISTVGQMKSLGFSKNQLATKQNNRVLIENITFPGYTIFQADDPMHETFTNTHQFKLALKLQSTLLWSEVFQLTITKGDSLKNLNYVPLLKTVMKELTENVNLNVDLGYKDDKKEFKFTFPIHNSVANCTLIVSKDLAERLGFGLITDISETNKEGERVEDNFDVTKTETRSRALGYDTGVIIVTNEGTSSNLMSGFSDQFMCCLYPTSTGTFEIPMLESCFSPPTMSMPQQFQSASGFVPITFKLSRFLDTDQPVNLDWKNGAFISGLLRGVFRHPGI
jgi:hypothetical protein